MGWRSRAFVHGDEGGDGGVGEFKASVKKAGSILWRAWGVWWSALLTIGRYGALYRYQRLLDEDTREPGGGQAYPS